MFLNRIVSHAGWKSGIRRYTRSFSAYTALHEKPLPPRTVIPETDIEESFLKGSGPGGQKINKTSSAVQLKHIPTGIVVKNQETRSREQNRKNARRLLGEKLEDIEKGPLSRTAIKAEKARRKKASASKKTRRKYRDLEEAKAEGKDETFTEAIHGDADATSDRAGGEIASKAAQDTHKNENPDG